MESIDLLRGNFRNSPETVEYQNAMDKELEKAKSAYSDLLLQLDVDTATWGLDLYEKVYGILTDPSKPYEFRRSRIESKMRSQGVTTPAMIKNVAESFSNGKVELIEYPAEYRFEIKFIGTLGIPPRMDDLTAAIEEIKPAHLAYTYIYVFITHDQLKDCTHAQLAGYTHNQIRTEPIGPMLITYLSASGAENGERNIYSAGDSSAAERTLLEGNGSHAL